MLTLVSQAAVFTMLYSDSLARFVFEGDENFSGAHLGGVGESGYKIVLSLSILAIPSMFSGYLFKDFFIGFGAFSFADSIFLLPTAAHFFESDYLFATWRIAPVVTSFFINFLELSSILKKGAGGFVQLVVDFFTLN